MMNGRCRVRLASARTLSPSVRSLTFEPVDGGFEFRAGQSVQLTVPTSGGLAMRRPYSFASAPRAAAPGRFEIAVTKVNGGPASTALHALPIDGEVVAEGPNGGWLSRRPDERGLRTLLVATGSGLAPLRALLQEELTSRDGARLGLLFGCRTEDDILWRDELSVWSKAHERLRIGITLSRPGPGWNGRVGHVQQHLPELVREIEPELVLVCGLSAMADDVERELREQGVPDDVIRTEAFDR